MGNIIFGKLGILTIILWILSGRNCNAQVKVSVVNKTDKYLFVDIQGIKWSIGVGPRDTIRNLTTDTLMYDGSYEYSIGTYSNKFKHEGSRKVGYSTSGEYILEFYHSAKNDEVLCREVLISKRF